MATISEIYAQIGKLIADANEKTGVTDDDLTSAVRRLIAGYGFTPEEINIDLSNVVEWFHNDLKDAVSYVQSLGDNWVHHLVIADTHYEHNYRHSLQLMNALDGTGLFDRAIHLGDITDGSTGTLAVTARQDFIDDGWDRLSHKAMVCVGNHDGKYNTTDMPLSSYKDAMMGDNPDNVYNEADTDYSSYYYDDMERKIRYIVVYYNYGASSTKGDQMRWMYERICELDDGWTYFTLSHYPGIKSTENSSAEQDKLTGWLRLAQLTQWDRLTYGGHLCGHTHIDNPSATDLLSAATLTCDRYQFVNESGDYIYDTFPMEEGTNTEQAITIWSINPVDKKVKFYRIGAVSEANGRQFGYDMITLEPNKAYENGGWFSTAMPMCTFTNGLANRTAYLTKKLHWTNDYAEGTIFSWRTDGKPVYAPCVAWFADEKCTEYVTRTTGDISATTDILKYQRDTFFHGIWYISQTTNSLKREMHGIVCLNLREPEEDWKNVMDNAVKIAMKADMPVLQWGYNAGTWFDGGNISGTGTIQAASGWSTNALITVEPNTTYRYYGDGVVFTDSYVSCYEYPCSYTASQGYARGFIKRDNKKTTDGIVTFTTTADTHYIAFAVNLVSDDATKVKFEKVE